MLTYYVVLYGYHAIAICSGRSRSDFLSSVSCAEIDLRSVVFWDVNRGSQLASLSSRLRAAAYSRAGARTACD